VEPAIIELSLLLSDNSSLSYNAVDNYIIISTLLLFCQYLMSESPI